MKNKAKRILKPEHVVEVMNKNIMIGRDQAANGKPKEFLFNPFLNDHIVKMDGEIIDAGQDLEALLNTYNEL